MDITLTCCKKLYSIAELFNDDLSLVATTINICSLKDDHKVILNHLINGDIERYSKSIDIIFKVVSDNYNVDGVLTLIEHIHNSIPHSVDQVRNNVDSGITVGDDLKKGARLSLFGDE